MAGTLTPSNLDLGGVEPRSDKDETGAETLVAPCGSPKNLPGMRPELQREVSFGVFRGAQVSWGSDF